MLIRFTKAARTPTHGYQAGRVADLPDAIAAKFVSDGVAVEQSAVTPERADVEYPTHKATKRQGKPRVKPTE